MELEFEKLKMLLPAFISSSYTTSEIVSIILNQLIDHFMICHLEEVIEKWDSLNNGIYSTDLHFQKSWDNINREFRELYPKTWILITPSILLVS